MKQGRCVQYFHLILHVTIMKLVFSALLMETVISMECIDALQIIHVYNVNIMMIAHITGLDNTVITQHATQTAQMMLFVNTFLLCNHSVWMELV
jgi:hypothetical protein